MDPFVAIIGGMTVFLVLFAVALGLWHPRSGNQIVGRSLRNEEAEAEIEAHDIDDMLNAIAERRRRLGRRDIGEELADELMRGTWDEQ